MSANACFTWSKSLSVNLTFLSTRMHNQVSAKYFPCPLPILLSKVTNLTLSLVKVEGLTQKYTSMVFTHQIASSVSPEKTLGRASLTVLVLVVVDIGFAGGGTGLAGGCDGETVDKGAKINGVVIGTTEDTVVTKGVTGGSGLVTGILGWEPEGGSGVLRLGGEGSEAGLTVYWHPKTLFEEEEEGSIGVVGLVGDWVCGVTAKSKGFWGVPVSSNSLGTWKTFLGRWGEILGWLGWFYSWIGGTKGDSCSFVMQVNKLMSRSRHLLWGRCSQRDTASSKQGSG